MINNGYYDRYLSLKDLFFRAYTDYYALNCVDHYNKTIKESGTGLIKAEFYVMQHICNLLKSDFALTAWKIDYDTHPNSNTIGHLRAFLKSEIKDDVKLLKPVKYDHDTKEKICTIRKQSLAHSDRCKDHISIEISEIEMIIDAMRTNFNQLCLNCIDERVEPITDRKLTIINLHITEGLGLMLEQGTVPVE